MSRPPRRRHPLAFAGVLVAGLIVAGVAFAAVDAGTTASAATSTATASQTQVEQGRQLYVEGCVSCHGIAGQGSAEYPSLIGAGAAAVDFQVRTGRMPATSPMSQIPTKPRLYSDDEIAALAAYVASLGAGPAIPSDAQIDYSDADLGEGGVLFRTNCMQCHNFAGKGGALSEGAFAPNLMNASAREIYEAMLTGPQNMPIFSDTTLTPEAKQAIIAYVKHLQDAPDPGGFALGSFGPVTEGVFIWTAGLGLLIAVAVWVGAKVR